MSAYQSIRGFSRWLRAKVLRSEVRIAGRCKMCGCCCRDLRLMDHGQWIRTMKQHRRLMQESPEYERFAIIGRDPYGFFTYSCSCCGEDGLCTDYKERPSVCSGYPAPSLYYRGIDPPSHCGLRYEALTFSALFRRITGKEKTFATILQSMQEGVGSEEK